MADQLRINGVQHSWSSTKLKIEGETFTGITAINYGDALTPTKAYGMGRAHAPRGRTRGKYEPDPIEMTLFKGTAEELRTKLAELSESGTSYGIVEFQMVLQFVENDDTPCTIEFIDCRVSADKSSNEENPDPSVENWTLDVMRILRNGKALYDDSEGQ